VGVELPVSDEVLEIGRGRVMREGEGIALLSFGAHLSEALAAADLLAEEGLQVTVADARFAKPLDTALIDRLIDSHGALVTLEQGAPGGFGAQVLHYLAASGGLDRGRLVRTLTLPDRFIDQASPAEMYAEAGLRASDIAATLRGLSAKLKPTVVPMTRPRPI
jgi:1-deoxy-D-xylulose-5-phosphate synthase